jgi:hypothetical protein
MRLRQGRLIRTRHRTGRRKRDPARDGAGYTLQGGIRDFLTLRPLAKVKKRTRMKFQDGAANPPRGTQRMDGVRPAR